MDSRETEFDRKLALLRVQPTDRQLRSLEPDVWRRIERRSATGAAPTLPWRAATVGLSLALGAAIGGAAAARTEQQQEMSVFSVRASLAPSTLLADR